MWRGPRATGDQIWGQLSNGAIAGIWRRAESPAGSDRFFMVREDSAKITLVELSISGSTTTYEAIEQGERTVVFESPDHGQLRLRGDGHELDLDIEPKGGAIEHHHFWLEI